MTNIILYENKELIYKQNIKLYELKGAFDVALNTNFLMQSKFSTHSYLSMMGDKLKEIIVLNDKIIFQIENMK
jgi:hypothetical protein